tara:strand:- start:329 stop:517 length:189 start_codon:yes stop_codon:yes gene_type:complete
MKDPNINTATGQYRVIRKKGDLTGQGKGDWRRGCNTNSKWRENYDKIFKKSKKKGLKYGQIT